MEQRKSRVAETKATYRAATTRPRTRRLTVKESARMVARAYAEAFRELEKN